MVHIFHRAFEQTMASHAQLHPRFADKSAGLAANEHMARHRLLKRSVKNMRQLSFCVYSKGPGAHRPSPSPRLSAQPDTYSPHGQGQGIVDRATYLQVEAGEEDAVVC